MTAGRYAGLLALELDIRAGFSDTKTDAILKRQYLLKSGGRSGNWILLCLSLVPLGYADHGTWFIYIPQDPTGRLPDMTSGALVVIRTPTTCCF
jgi:hypothetical protein